MQNLPDTKNIHVYRKLRSIPRTSVDFLTQQENLITSLCLPRVSVYSADYQLVQWLCKRKITNISPHKQYGHTCIKIHSNACFVSVYSMQKTPKSSNYFYHEYNIRLAFIMNMKCMYILLLLNMNNKLMYNLLLSWI